MDFHLDNFLWFVAIWNNGWERSDNKSSGSNVKSWLWHLLSAIYHNLDPWCYPLWAKYSSLYSKCFQALQVLDCMDVRIPNRQVPFCENNIFLLIFNLIINFVRFLQYWHSSWHLTNFRCSSSNDKCHSIVIVEDVKCYSPWQHKQEDGNAQIGGHHIYPNVDAERREEWE